jgi:acyl-CoA synthetase (AMP-forming)/AMP-acid ligase II
MNIASVLDRAHRIAGDAPALAQGTRVLASYRELRTRAAALAQGLGDIYGLRPGDRVALFMKNSPEYVEALFACWRAGLIVVPVNCKLHPEELRYILDDSGARVVFTTPSLESAGSAACRGSSSRTELAVTGSHEWHRLRSGAGASDLHASKPDDTAWLFYTSGTTGKPKGAMLTHRNLMAMSLNFIADVDTIAGGDALLHASPMSHGSGLYILPYVVGTALHIVPESSRFDPTEVLDLIAHHGKVSLFAAPTMVRRLATAAEACNWNPDRLKTIVYGGGPMYVADCKAALGVFGPRLVQIYGQGESPMTITVLPKRFHADFDHPRYEQRLASVGYAQAVVEVMVADEDGNACSVGSSGEVLVRGDTVMKGYWNRPEGIDDAQRSGWLHTGDVGALDDEGWLTLKDRTRDVIISGGTNIYPREIEEVLLLHPGVSEVSVVGRPHPDWGEEVVAFVVTRNGEPLASTALDTICNDHLARFKRPRHYRFLPGLPKNEYGKVLKTALRPLAREPGS